MYRYYIGPDRYHGGHVVYVLDSRDWDNADHLCFSMGADRVTRYEAIEIAYCAVPSRGTAWARSTHPDHKAAIGRTGASYDRPTPAAIADAHAATLELIAFDKARNGTLTETQLSRLRLSSHFREAADRAAEADADRAAESRLLRA